MVTDAIDLAGSLTLPAEGLGRALALDWKPRAAAARARELRGLRRRDWESVRLRQARRRRCCRTLVLVRRPFLRLEPES
jgi:hypothetical protein